MGTNKGKSTTRGELASSNESVRRESVVAKEKQIDGLVEEAKSFENDLKKLCVFFKISNFQNDFAFSKFQNVRNLY